MLDSQIGLKLTNMNIFLGALIASLMLFLPGFQSNAQAPGFAEVLDPQGGEAIQGVYTIRGSASHPAFLAYQLSFAYAQDPTNTWFLLGEHQENQIVDHGLGLWDTTGISDGEYRLRLEVFLRNETSIVTIVEGVRIRNHTAIEAATPAPFTVQVMPTEPLPTKTPRPTPFPALASQGSSHVQQALLVGAVFGLLSICGLGIYLFIRRRTRQRWGMLRMRQILREQARTRKSGDEH
jgi:hypothetical protein